MRFPGLFFCLLFISVTFLFNVNAQEPLPKWMTEHEKVIYQDYLDNLPQPKSTSPPSTPPRTPGEFEELLGVVIAWTGFNSELREITRHARTAVNVFIITDNVSGVQNYLLNGNVPLDNIFFIQAPFNSIWIRDYGPQSTYLNGTDELAFIDWNYNRPRPLDNQVPQFLANHLDLPIFQMAYQSTILTATGGNFMADGHGTAFSSKLILAENPSLTEAQIDQIFYEFKGIHTYIKMDELPYDNISHLDMHMKLLDEETLLVGEFPQGISDGPFIEANLGYLLNNYNTCYGRSYNVVRIPMAPSPTGNYPPNAHYRTYTNSVILNNVVLVPTYGSYLDEYALEVYQSAMPGYEIIGINMSEIIPLSGAIHCITREIAAHDPIFISHPSIRWEEVENLDAYEIKAYISNQAGIDNAKVFWTTDTGKGFESIDMVLQNDTFYAHIPAQECFTNIHYYISATNNNGKSISKPLVAPDGYYSFTVEDVLADFYADNRFVEVGEEVTFFMEYCQEPEEVNWNFGIGAEPATAQGIGPHTVKYNQSGAKTISLTSNNQTITQENYILVNDSDSFILIINTIGEGITNPEAGEHVIDADTEIELSAFADDGWKFTHWSINDEEYHTSSDMSLTIDKSMFITALFEEIETSVPFAEQTLKFNVFPNPAGEQINISVSPQASKLNVVLTDLYGQIVLHDELHASDFEILQTYHVNHLPAGIYIMRLSNGNEMKTQKIIVQ